MRMVLVRKAAVVMAMVLATSAIAQTVDEYHMKAAFVFNFAKFIQWPTQVFRTLTDPLVICVLGEDQWRFRCGKQ